MAYNIIYHGKANKHYIIANKVIRQTSNWDEDIFLLSGDLVVIILFLYQEFSDVVLNPFMWLIECIKAFDLSPKWTKKSMLYHCRYLPARHLAS